MTTELEVKPDSPDLHTPPATSHKKPLCVGLIILVLLMSGVALYTSFTVRQHNTDLVSTIEELKQQQAALSITMTDQAHKLSQAQDSLHEQINTQHKQLQSVVGKRLFQQNNWQLLSARYYLELAEVNAHWNGDTQTTQALLQQTDRVLANIHDARALEIRQAIAGSLATIQQASHPDLSGLLSELDAAQRTIAHLPLRAPWLAKQQQDTPPLRQDKAESPWRQQVNNTLSALEKLVIIRHHSDTTQPLLTPAMETMLREQVQLILQETQWALLQHDEDIYKLTLQQAIVKIKHAFSPEASTALVTQLQTLKDKPIKLEPLTINAALLLLNTWIDADKTGPSDEQRSAGSRL